MEERKRFILPVSWNMKPGFQIILIAIVLIIVGFVSFKFLSKPSGTDTGKSKSSKGIFSFLASGPDAKGGFNNFPGFAPGFWINDGINMTKESRMYKEFGITFEAVRMDKFEDLFNGLKSGELDFIFVTTDIFPISMDKTSDLALMSVKQFLKIDDSRGADLFIVNDYIKTIADLRGKKIACALGWPSNTLLHKTLEAGGLTEKDVIILPMNTPGDAKNAFLSGEAEAVVLWYPDNIACLDIPGRPTRVLTQTEIMPNIIMDGFIARKDVLEKKHDIFVKLAEAWLTANAEMSIPGNMEKAAEIYKVAFNVEDKVADLVDGMKKIHFATYGDNVNFFGLSSEFEGKTGLELYKEMSRAYKTSYGNNIKDIVPWGDASDASIVQDIKNLTGEKHAAEGQIKFTAPTQEQRNAPALTTKPVIINFETNSWLLTPDMQDKIKRELGSTLKDFAGVSVLIEGNTDNTGGPKFDNVSLSQKRAQSVADFLAKTYNFDPKRFTVQGNGSSKPVASNDTDAGREANRRTEFKLLSTGK